MRFRLRPVEILTRYERRTVQGRLEPIDHCHANGRNRRSAEARDSTDGLPLTVRERSFVLRPPDGKVCPLRDVAGELSDSPSWEMGWTPLTVQKDGRTRYYSGDIARIVGAVPDLAVGRP